ncbi:MAG: hypothetical protein ACPG85_02695, partial [Flavobacteriales bacterium]
ARRWAGMRYVLGDGLASVVAWTTLFLFRKRFLELAPAYVETWFPARLLEDGNFLFGTVFVPMFWIGLYGPACIRNPSGATDRRKWGRCSG